MFTFAHLLLSAALMGTALAGTCTPPPVMPPCTATEMMCPLGVDANNCDMGSSCLPNMAGLCTNHCPVTCAPGDLICPGPVDVNNCPMPQMCIPQAPKGSKCPAQCPNYCNPNDLTCPNGNDANGCPMPDQCIPQPAAAAAALPGTCPAFCPTKCMATEQLCPGTMDSNGCTSAGMCMPTMAGKCPVFCPLQYQPTTQKLCDYDMDPAGLCRMPPYTMPINGNCPALCANDRLCVSKTAQYCPMNDPTTGCEMHGACMEPTMDKNNLPCPIKCPIMCGTGQQMCPGPMDSNNCMMPDTCIPATDTCPMPTPA